MRSQVRLPRPSVALDELEPDDDFADRYFCWPRAERTTPPVPGTIDNVARMLFGVERTAPPARAANAFHVVDQFFTGSIVLDLNALDFSDELHHLVIEVPLLDPVEGSVGAELGAEPELGAPKVDVLLGAVEDLMSWLGLTKQKVSKYVGIGYTTVLSWRRERPSYPRHPNISTLLALWAAVSGAQEEFGADEAVRMVWAAGRTEDGLPARPAAELANWLIDLTSEASLAGFLEDDGYVPGTAPMPDVEDLTRAEAELHATLSSARTGSGDTAGR